MESRCLVSGFEFPVSVAMGPDDPVKIPRSRLSQLVSAGR